MKKNITCLTGQKENPLQRLGSIPTKDDNPHVPIYPKKTESHLLKSINEIENMPFPPCQIQNPRHMINRAHRKPIFSSLK